MRVVHIWATAGPRGQELGGSIAVFVFPIGMALARMIFVAAILPAVLFMLFVSFGIVKCLPLHCVDPAFRTGGRHRTGLADIFPDGGACGTACTGTHHGAGLSAHGLSDHRASRTAHGTTHHGATLTGALGADRGTRGAAQGTPENGAVLAADRLPHHGPGSGAQTATHGSFDVIGVCDAYRASEEKRQTGAAPPNRCECGGCPGGIQNVCSVHDRD